MVANNQMVIKTSDDMEKELYDLISDEIAHEFMEKYNFTDDQISRAKQRQKETGKSLTTCVLDINYIDQLIKLYKGNNNGTIQ